MDKAATEHKRSHQNILTRQKLRAMMPERKSSIAYKYTLLTTTVASTGRAIFCNQLHTGSTIGGAIGGVGAFGFT